jgi:hypothetical protein
MLVSELVSEHIAEVVTTPLIPECLFDFGSQKIIPALVLEAVVLVRESRHHDLLSG